MAALATVTQLELHVRRPIVAGSTAEAEATQALEGASAVVRGYARQTFTAVTETVTLPGTWDTVLLLPQRPVTAVTSISIDDTAVTMTDVDWRRDGTMQGVAWGGDLATVTVNYSHGYTAVPDDVRHVVLNLAARIWDNPTAVRQQTVGSFSESVTLPALQAWETVVLDRHRRRTAAL